MATLRAPLFGQEELNLSAPQLAAVQLDGMSSLRRGYEAGRIGTDINAAAAQEASLRRAAEAGDAQALAEAEALRANIGGLQQRQAMYAPEVSRVEDINWNPGRALSWAAGQVGQGAASMQDPVAVGAALQGAGRLASAGPGVMKAVGAGLRGAGYAVPFIMNQRQMTGEAYNAMAADPELMARTSAAERELNANLYGAGAGALDTVVPGMIAGKLTGAGLRQGIAKSGLGTRTLVGMGAEGATETGQQFGQQQVLGYMNPDRDTSGDFMENVNAFAGGAIGAGPMVMAGEAADSGYRRIGNTAQRVSEKAGEVVDLLQEKAEPYVNKAKGKLDKVVDLFAGEDGKVTPSSVKDTVMGKAKDMYADFDQKLQERDLIAGMPPDGMDPDSQEFKDWHTETNGKRTQTITDKLGAMADAGDQRAQELYAQLDTQDDAQYVKTVEDGAQHILESDEWGRFSQEVERRAKQASRWSTKFGELAGKAGRMAGGAAVNFGKAVIDGVKSGTKKNMQGESLVGQGAVYDPEGMRLRDVAIDREADRWDEGKQRSYRRAQLMSEFLAEEVKTARAMPGVRMPSGSPEAMTGFAKDMALEIADLAENWKPTVKSKGPNPTPSGPTSTLRSPADSRGQQFDGLTLSLNSIARSMKLMYGDKSGQVLNELQAIDGNTAPELFDLIRSELDVQGTRAAAQHNARVEREAQDALINTLATKIEPELEGQLRTGAGKKKLLDMVKAIDDGVAPPAAKREFEKVFGKEALLALRRTLRPSRASRDDLIDDMGATLDSGVTVNDDGEVEVAESNQLDKALGETKRDRMGAKRMIGFRGTQRVRLEGGDKKDVFAAAGGVTREKMLEFQDEFSRALEEGKAPDDRPLMPAGMRRPQLAFRGDTFTGGEDAVEGSRVRFERRIGAERTPDAMIKSLRAEGNEKAAAMAESMLKDGIDLMDRSRAFFENRSEGGKWSVKSVSVKDYLDEEGADPLRRVALYRDYIQQAAYARSVTPEEHQKLSALARRLSTVVGDMAGQQKGTTNKLRTSPMDRKEAVEAANRYFADHFVNVADQATDAIPEQISAGEIDAMAEMGKRMLDSARKGRGNGEYNFPVLSKKNIIMFEHRDKDSKGKAVYVPIPANRLAAWGNFQLAAMEGTKEQGHKEDQDASFSNTDKDMEFLRGLSLGIQAIRTSGVVKDAFPTKVNAKGGVERFQSTGAYKHKVLTDPDGSNPRNVQIWNTRLKGALAVLDGLPPSLELATMTVDQLKFKIEKGSERYRNEILPKREEYQSKNSFRIEAQSDAEKLGNWSAEPFVAKQDENELPPSEVWGHLSHHVEAAGGRMSTDKSRVTGAASRRNKGGWRTMQKDGIYSEISRESTPTGQPTGGASRPKAYVEGPADPISGKPEYRGRINIATPGDNRTYKTSATGGWNEKGTKYEYGPTPSDFGDAPEGFEDVRDRTKAQGRSAVQRSKGELGPEVPMTASKMAESRAQTIRAALVDDPLGALAIIERRLRQAEQPRWGVGKNEVVGGAQYAIPVIKALDDDTLAQFDADDELKSLRDKAIDIVRRSDLNKMLKAEFAPEDEAETETAAKGVGASLGKPSGVGKVKLTGTSTYLSKDQAKSDRANKFIGRGSATSSTAQYAKDWGDRANTGSYTADDVVFVSAEGNRSGRIGPDLNELNKAMAAGATLITDSATTGRNRPYNVGEREVAAHLTKHGYTESEPGTWTPGKPTGVGTKTGTKFNRQSEGIHMSLGREGFAATHDSPILHEGKFDWRAHIGKGEGNAAFGAGTYLSTSDGVHKSYKSMFTGMVVGPSLEELRLDLQQKEAELPQAEFAADPKNWEPVISSRYGDAMRLKGDAAGEYGYYSQAVDFESAEVKWYAPWRDPDSIGYDSFEDAVRDEHGEYVVHLQKKIAKLKKKIREYREPRFDKSPTYQVSVNIEPDQLLDWNKPLNEQSHTVQVALESEGFELDGRDGYSGKHLTGESVYRRIAGNLGSQAKASDYLQSLGILGHRYAAVGGKNDTHPNYVIYDDKRITTNYVHFNKQGATKASTQAERDAAVAEIVKTIGKDIDVRFEQTTGFSGAYNDKEAAIIISLTPAAGTLQTAYHEALHAFVSRLVKGNDRAKEVLNTLANYEPTMKRVVALLDGHPEAQAQLTDGEERIAYIYQFWRAGLLDLPVSPARTLLQKLRKFFRGILGQVSDLERSSDLLDAFARGSYAGDPSVAGKVMAKHLLAGTWTARTLRKMDGLTQAIAAAVVPAQSLLLISESPTAQKLGNTFWTNPGDEESAGMKEGYLNARERMAKRYTNEFSRIVAGLTERDHKDVITYLQKETDPANIPYEPHRQAVEKIRALLQRFRTYMVDERGHKIGDRGPLYFPRVWSAATLRAKKGAFISMMQTNHPSYDAEAVYNALVKNFDESNEDALHGREIDDDDAVLSPTQSAKGERVLGFITGEQAQPFLEQSLVGTLSRYFHEGARAAEYTHRFGRKGERLELALSTIHAELRQAGAKKRKAGELKDQDAETKWVERQMRDVERSVDAMEGTLGRDIGDNWRATNSWVTVYQNVRLLPLALFSSIVDPLGMVARGATMREAYDGFLRGMSEVVRNWGEMITGDVKERKLDKWERLASAVGSVDAAVWNHHVSDEYASVYMSPAAKKINDIMFKANGMESWNRGMRIAATRSAVMFIQRHKNLPDTHSARWLEEIGLKPADIDINADGELITDKHALATHLGIDKDAAAAKIDKIHYAINRWVQGAILTPNAAQRPAWGSDPHYSMFFHLKQFSYSFHQTLIKRAVNEMEHGNLAPMGAFIWYIPVMIASDITKGLIQGGGELPAHMKGMDLGDWLMHGAQRAGLLGVGQMGVDATGDLSSIGGPAVEQVIDAFSDPLERTTIKAMPAHGLYAEALR